MSDLKQRQLDALQRFAYMLDEYSIQYLAAQDAGFEQVVQNLYKSLDQQAVRLQTTA